MQAGRGHAARLPTLEYFANKKGLLPSLAQGSHYAASKETTGWLATSARFVRSPPLSLPQQQLNGDNVRGREEKGICAYGALLLLLSYLNAIYLARFSCSFYVVAAASEGKEIRRGLSLSLPLSLSLHPFFKHNCL